MKVLALAGLQLTEKGQAEIHDRRSVVTVTDWCASLWGDNPVHQCVRQLRHDGGCRCVCGEDRTAS